MKHYELMYILPVKVGVDDDKAIQDKIKAMLVAEGAAITAEDSLGKRKLAYPINSIRHGSYTVIEMDLEPAKLQKIQTWFRLSSEILRSQIIVKKVKTAEQIAREKAIQARVAKDEAMANMAEAEAKKEETPAPSKETITDDKTAVHLDDLDKKLAKILEKEIVN